MSSKERHPIQVLFFLVKADKAPIFEVTTILVRVCSPPIKKRKKIINKLFTYKTYKLYKNNKNLHSKIDSVFSPKIGSKIRTSGFDI